MTMVGTGHSFQNCLPYTTMHAFLLTVTMVPCLAARSPTSSWACTLLLHGCCGCHFLFAAACASLTPSQLYLSSGKTPSCRATGLPHHARSPLHFQRRCLPPAHHMHHTYLPLTAPLPHLLRTATTYYWRRLRYPTKLYYWRSTPGRHARALCRVGRRTSYKHAHTAILSHLPPPSCTCPGRGERREEGKITVGTRFLHPPPHTSRPRTGCAGSRRVRCRLLTAHSRGRLGGPLHACPLPLPPALLHSLGMGSRAGSIWAPLTHKLPALTPHHHQPCLTRLLHRGILPGNGFTTGVDKQILVPLHCTIFLPAYCLLPRSCGAVAAFLRTTHIWAWAATRRAYLYAGIYTAA